MEFDGELWMFLDLLGLACVEVVGWECRKVLERETEKSKISSMIK